MAIAGDTPDPFEHLRRLQEQGERIQRMMNPPAFEQLRQLQEQSERFRRMMNPPAFEQLRQLQEQSERFRRMMNPPALEHLRQLQEQSERIQRMMNPPGLEQLRQLEEQQSRLQALFQNPIVGSLRERRAEWDDLLTPEAVAEIDTFQADLASRVIASAEPVTDEAAEGEGVWFGAASWATLLAEIEGLLKAMEVITAAMTASKMALHAPVPTAILALLIVLISATEFALWLAKQEIGE